MNINSAYCWAREQCAMPTGKPGPYKILDSVGFFHYELDTFFGFIEATVYCPPDLDPPVLPFITSDKRILYPTGVFKGFFFYEEIKLAKKMGYFIEGHRYIQFRKNFNLFKDFIKDTYSNRLKHPKKSPQNLFYQIIMLSVFGRFALNPTFEIVKIANHEKDFLKILESLNYVSHNIFSTVSGEQCYVVRFHARKSWDPTSDKGAPFISSTKAKNLRIAPQISAAISSYVRMNLYDVLSKNEEYNIAYTDTDSVFLNKPLPGSEVSDTKLGKCKFEGEYDKGIFMGKKVYLWEKKYIYGKKVYLWEKKYIL